tara:strand:- start:541 stop:1605 length:1065 start_codon:yes stop_codon:yes gene_type:complete
MATFFDKKQDVIDIELTKYGEYLLSLGKFKPVYYSFFDNNVLYDTRYAGFSGSQNSFEGRIQEDTPSLRTQHSFEGRGEQVLAYNEAMVDVFHLREDEKIRFPSTVDKHFTALYDPLGHSDLSSTKAPAWKMRFYHNEMLNWETMYTGSRSEQKIPQIDATITYKTRVRTTQNPPLALDPQTGQMVPQGIYQPNEVDPELGMGIFADGTFVEVEGDYILLDLQEINALYERDNFEIEVYEIKTQTFPNGNTRDELIPLQFREKKPEIVNNLLVEDTGYTNVTLDPSYAEYFFDVLVDEEISDVIICKSLSELKAKGVYIETPFECPDLSPSATVGLYSSENTEGAKCATETGEG